MSKFINFDFSKLAEAWDAPIVSREDVARFSGGLLRPRTMANLDSLGKGPGKIKVGRKVCYDKNLLVEWLRKRHTILPA